jgi:hypothetical protein
LSANAVEQEPVFNLREGLERILETLNAMSWEDRADVYGYLTNPRRNIEVARRARSMPYRSGPARLTMLPGGKT